MIPESSKRHMCSLTCDTTSRPATYSNLDTTSSYKMSRSSRLSMWRYRRRALCSPFWHYYPCYIDTVSHAIRQRERPTNQGSNVMGNEFSQRDRSLFLRWLSTKRSSVKANKIQGKPRHIKPNPLLPPSTSGQSVESGQSKGEDSNTATSSSTLLRHWLEQLQAPPNLLTLCRIAATPVLSYWVITGNTWPAIVGCCLAAASDAADGFLARNFNMGTTLGTYLDPLGKSRSKMAHGQL
jgi:CDP-alcohol phosphatidyltransferase